MRNLVLLLSTFFSLVTFAGYGGGYTSAGGGPVLFGNYHLEPANIAVGNCGSSQTVDLSTGNVVSVTLNAATCTLTLTNPQTAAVYLFKLTEDATGSRAVSWPGTVKWPASTAPTLSGANKVDVIWCYWDGASYYCNSILNY